MPRLYEIIAFCPAFNANRTGEIRSEQRSSFVLKARLGLCWGQKARGVPFKSKKMETKHENLPPPSKASQLLATGTVSTSGYRLRSAFVAQESPAWAKHLAGLG